MTSEPAVKRELRRLRWRMIGSVVDLFVALSLLLATVVAAGRERWSEATFWLAVAAFHRWVLVSKGGDHD